MSMKVALPRVLSAYAGLGPRPVGVPRAFSHFHCPRWRNPVMSPVWPTERSAAAADLARLEAFFKRHPKRRPFDDARMGYLTALLGPGGHDVRRIAAAAASRGWTRRDSGTLEAWLRPERLSLPDGYYASSARVGASPLHRDFLRLCRESFHWSARFEHEIVATYRTLAARTLEVVLYSRSRRPAAAGLVTTQGGGAFLWCGSVSPRHRGRGLHRALRAARQHASRADGAEFWATSTRNPRISGRGELSWRIAMFF
ncbi:MAG: hypothetical protein HYV15_05400, partial [Elusimicrobia bacterium]|nr:hypothetical protein [Elusimicrobiota bacterium]